MRIFRKATDQHSVDRLEKSYDFIDSIIKGHAETINAPKNYLPTMGKNETNSRSYIEIDSRKMIHYTTKRKGKRSNRESAIDLKFIIYWVFEEATSLMAKDFAEHNNILGKDPRKIEFEKQKELLGLINEDYINWIEDEQMKILKKNPYND